MNLQPVTVDDVPIGVPLPWQLFDRQGYSVFARGEVIAERKSLMHLLTDGLLRDVDALPEAANAPDWVETIGPAPSEVFPPNGIKPQIGERVQIRLLGREAQVFYLAHLIGYVRGRTILITVPENAGQRIDMSDGEKLEVRMFTGGNIYVFQSMIQRACISPVHYMHLDYPDSLRIQRLRRSPWAAVDLLAAVSERQGDKDVAHIVNLSPDGAKLHTPSVLGGKGERLQLRIHAGMDEIKNTLFLEAVIQHVRTVRAGAGEDTAMLEYGLEFRRVSPQDALWLKCFVYRRIAEGHPA